MSKELPITVDFETEAIEGNPTVTPPKPIGVAIWEQGKEATYDEIGRPGGLTLTQAKRLLRRVWRHPGGVLFHNAPFDLSVAEHWLDVPWPAWDKIHDTQYLVFHFNPYGTLRLKEASEEILNWPPEEQDLLHEWIIENIPAARSKPSTAGAYICEAPVELVRPYAIGDVERTWGLYEYITKNMEYMYADS